MEGRAWRVRLSLGDAAGWPVSGAGPCSSASAQFRSRRAPIELADEAPENPGL